MIEFTVTKESTFSDISLLSTCGYPVVDKKMLHLMNNLPMKWEAASNEKDEQVDRIFIFTYGQAGC